MIGYSCSAIFAKPCSVDYLLWRKAIRPPPELAPRLLSLIFTSATSTYLFVFFHQKKGERREKKLIKYLGRSIRHFFYCCCCLLVYLAYICSILGIYQRSRGSTGYKCWETVKERKGGEKPGESKNYLTSYGTIWRTTNQYIRPVR